MTNLSDVGHLSLCVRHENALISTVCRFLRCRLRSSKGALAKMATDVTDNLSTLNRSMARQVGNSEANRTMIGRFCPVCVFQLRESRPVADNFQR